MRPSAAACSKGTYHLGGVCGHNGHHGEGSKSALHDDQCAQQSKFKDFTPKLAIGIDVTNYNNVKVLMHYT
jgi:hypothetical protein